MPRTALQPRWLGLLGFALLCSGGFIWLGWWQLGVAADRAADQYRQQVAQRPTAPIDTVLRPQQLFTPAADARSVSAEGTFDAGRQLLIPGRLQRGRPGWWIVGALRTDVGWLAVVRGWTTDPLAATDAEGGRVRVLGVLQPDEGPKPINPDAGPAEVASLDAAELANRWGTPVFNAYLIASQETAVTSGDSARLPGTQWVPAPGPQNPGLSWRNAAYAVQWWIFAGFTLVLWWKMVRQAAAARPEESEPR
ncbi:MAG: SURF1 family protein [Angustibacter sp.]